MSKLAGFLLFYFPSGDPMFISNFWQELFTGIETIFVDTCYFFHWWFNKMYRRQSKLNHGSMTMNNRSKYIFISSFLKPINHVFNLHLQFP